MMTSTKQIALGFLLMAAGFGFFLLALTGIGASPNNFPANLFVGYPPQEVPLASYASDLGNAVRLEQLIGLVLLVIGLAVGAIGCFRRT